MEEYEVSLYVYDLSNGMAASMSQQLTGEYFEAIYHTGVGYNGREWYFGGGIFNDPLNQTPYGKPFKVIKLGKTSITPDIFQEFIENIRPRFRMEDYNLLSHNCNNFSDEISQFLLGKGIPTEILELPKRALSTPLGQMIMPFIQNYQNQMTNFYSPNTQQKQQQNFGSQSQPQLKNSFTTNNVSSSNNNKFEIKLIKKSNLVFFKDKNVLKIVPKLKSFVLTSSLKDTFNDFDNLMLPFTDQLQKVDVNQFQPPQTTISSVLTLCSELSDENKYPAMDLLKLVLFNESNLQPIYDSKIIPTFLQKYHNTEQSKGFKLVLFRIISNLFSTPSGIKYLLEDSNIELLADCAVKSLNEPEIFTLMGASSLTYNLSFHLSYEKNLDQYIQLTSCLVDKINEIQESSELYSNVSLLFLISLGNLVYQNQENKELVNTLHVNLDKFNNSKVEKVKQAAKELAYVLK